MLNYNIAKLHSWKLFLMYYFLYIFVIFVVHVISNVLILLLKIVILSLKFGTFRFLSWKFSSRFSTTPSEESSTWTNRRLWKTAAVSAVRATRQAFPKMTLIIWKSGTIGTASSQSGSRSIASSLTSKYLLLYSTLGPNFYMLNIDII